MVDMATFAVLRACHRFGLPLIGLRGISDGTEELRHVGDWTEYLHVVDDNLATAVDRLASALENGDLRLCRGCTKGTLSRKARHDPDNYRGRPSRRHPHHRFRQPGTEY